MNEKPNWRCPHCSLDPTSLGAYCDEHRSKPNAAPEWKLVPVEPTGAMAADGWNEGLRHLAGAQASRACYRAMLAAAPNLPDSETRDTEAIMALEAVEKSVGVRFVALRAAVERVCLQVGQADERGDEAMRLYHAAEERAERAEQEAAALRELLTEARHYVVNDAWEAEPPLLARIDAALKP